MFIEFSKEIKKELEKRINNPKSLVLNSLVSDWRSKTDYSVHFNKFTNEEFEILKEINEIYKDRSLSLKIKAIDKLMNSSELNKEKASNLPNLQTLLFTYFSENVIDGWLYEEKKLDENNSIFTPHLINDIIYTPYADDIPAKVTIELMSLNTNSKGLYKRTIAFSSADTKKTIAQLLTSNNFYHETPELKEMYLKDLEIFKDYYLNYKFKQFSCKISSYNNRNDYYNNYSSTKFSPDFSNKVINLEGSYEREVANVYLNDKWEKMYNVSEGFKDVPLQLFLKVFDLNSHIINYVHVNTLKPYIYDEKISSKIVLPDHQKDLIDTLVNDLSIIKSDVIEGKSSGTTILCVGEPGLGKTLSAEIFSESSKRPLYRVHSGDLGSSHERIEDNLKLIFERAKQWDAVVLIDEADIYIRERGNDTSHNSIVAVFLKTIEYFDGLLFLTSNRTKDIDDAIISRCIAVIEYDYPKGKELENIWKIVSETITGKPFTTKFIKELTETFEKMSGRDIKELTKLVYRFAKAKELKIEGNVDLFISCSQFKRIKLKGK